MSQSSLEQSDPQAVREQLGRILGDSLFSRGARQCRFLTHIVEATLAGEAEQLNQFVIGFEVFDRDESFDPSMDAIVRVEASRLRSKLAQYYDGPGRSDSIVIELPRGGYRASFRERVRRIQPVVRRPLGRSALLSALSAVAIAAVGIALYVALAAPERRGSAVDGAPNEVTRSEAEAQLAPAGMRPTIAILPFDNLSRDADQDYFSDGITEDIITDLSIVSGLKVLARHTTFVYKGRTVSIKQVGSELGARYVLEGSVRRAGDQLRITAQLIDAATETHIWAERYDRRLGDIFATQAEVSQRIVGSIGVKLTELEQRRLGHRGTDSVAAHDLYLRALDQFYLFTPDGVKRAIALFSQAIELDSGYAEAYAWRSRALVYTFVAGIDAPGGDTLDNALAQARRAIGLDGELPMAYANLAWALRWKLQLEEAIAAVARAIELNPNFADAYLWQSLILSTAGQGEKSLEAIERGMALDPYHGVTYVFAKGRGHLVLAEYEVALAQFDRAIERRPNFLPAHTHKMLALERTGRTRQLAEARAELARIAPDYEQSAAYRFYRDERLRTPASE